MKLFPGLAPKRDIIKEIIFNFAGVVAWILKTLATLKTLTKLNIYDRKSSQTIFHKKQRYGFISGIKKTGK